MCNGHPPTEASARWGVAVLQRLWWRVKVKVSGSIVRYCIIGGFQFLDFPSNHFNLGVFMCPPDALIGQNIHKTTGGTHGVILDLKAGASAPPLFGLRHFQVELHKTISQERKRNYNALRTATGGLWWRSTRPAPLSVVFLLVILNGKNVPGPKRNPPYCYTVQVGATVQCEYLYCTITGTLHFGA
jgi:hypothetical protein